MKKADAERAIRALCSEWARETDQDTADPAFHPSYGAFKAWAHGQGYGAYFKFRTAMSADYEAELWFDEEFKQTWRR